MLWKMCYQEVSHQLRGRIRDMGDPPAEVHAPDDNYHQNNGPLGTHGVKKDLGHGLTGLGLDRSIQILDRKQQSEDEEPTQNRGDTDSHHDANRPSPGGVMSFLRHLHIRFSIEKGLLQRESRTCALASKPVRVY